MQLTSLDALPWNSVTISLYHSTVANIHIISREQHSWSALAYEETHALTHWRDIEITSEDDVPFSEEEVRKPAR